MRVHRLLAFALLGAVSATAALADPPGLYGVVQPDANGIPSLAPPEPPPPTRPTRRRPAGAGVPASGAGILVRSGNHPGFGRLVFDIAGHPDVSARQEGDTVIVALGDADPVGLAAILVPRNVLGLSASFHAVTITLTPGVRLQSEQTGSELILDIMDAGPARPVAAAPPGDSDLGATEPPPAGARGRPSPARPQAAAQPALAPAGSAAAAGRLVPPSAAAASASLPPAAPAAAIPAPGTSGVPLGVPLGAPSVAPTEPVAQTGLPPLPDPAQRPDRQGGPGIEPASPDAATADLPDGAVSAPGWAEPRANSAVQPVHLVVNRIPVTEGSQGMAISLPFARTTGAAALPRGDAWLVVFDENRPLDLSALKSDPVFGSAGIQLLENATVLRLKLTPGSDLRLAPVATGWTIWVGPQGDPMDTKLEPLGSSVSGAVMTFTAALANRTVMVPDLETGGNLLVGTQRQAGQGVRTARRNPEFAVLPSIQGVAIEPTSDKPQLRVAAPGFVLSGGDRALALSDVAVGGDAVAEAAALSHRFDLPALSVPMLRQRLKNRIDESAATPPLSRRPAHRAVAEAMLALGLGPEAQGMLRYTVADDPRASDDLDSLALGAAAAIVAHRPREAASIEDPRLSGTDEIRLWRALRLAEQETGTSDVPEDIAPQVAAELAATGPIAAGYPDLLRNEVLPMLVETEILGGQPAAAEKLIEQRKLDPTLALAQGFLARAKGDSKLALAVFDKLAGGRDRRLRYRATLAAVALRLSAGEITAAQAADAGEKMLYAWRGDDRERALRMQIAAWRFQAGQWRGALAMLRESAGLFPALAEQYHHQMTETLRRLMRDPRVQDMDSIELISLLEDNVQYFPDGPEGQQAAELLADRMQRLDLDRRAAPVLERLAKTTPSLPARAAFGLRLATLRLAGGDAAGALSALSDSGSDGLSPGLIERRSIVSAQAEAAAGRGPEAVAALVAIGSPAANLARATILETAKDWAGAVAAMTAFVGQTVPPEGKLSTEQSSSVLRLAADLAKQGDEAGLASLRAQLGVRMATGPDAAAFRLLTEAPVHDVTDLPRAAKEMAAARAVAAAPVRQ